MTELCPICEDAPLATQKDPVTDAVIGYCDHCRGVFVPGTEAARVLWKTKLTPTEVSSTAHTAALECPICRRRSLEAHVAQHHYEGIWRCARCEGVMLAAGLFGRLRSAVPASQDSLRPAARTSRSDSLGGRRDETGSHGPAVVGMVRTTVPPMLADRHRAARSSPRPPSGAIRLDSTSSGPLELENVARPVAAASAWTHTGGTGRPSRLHRSNAPPRMSSPSSAAASAPVASTRPSARAREDEVLASDRLGYGHPVVDLVTLPALVALGFLLDLTSLGRMFFYLLALPFHEVGHAVPAWLSSRAALPLPCGFTMWQRDPSLFTGACVLFLLGLLGYRAFREERWFGVGLSAVLLLGFAYMSFVVSEDRSEMMRVAGGVAGEFWLSGLTMVAFHFRMPDRLRWDFFRFIFVVPAAFAFAHSTRLWLGIARGLERMPMGSLYGSSGDGSGDLERLVNDYGFTQQEIVRMYSTTAALCAAVAFFVYLAFAVRAAGRLRSEE